ncbi:MAG: hypothetical protein UIM53_05665 [Acutalibacteraceae bacterium]|nr:hypothetical protein [Acutalibacteraceae bacterium]
MAKKRLKQHIRDQQAKKQSKGVWKGGKRAKPSFEGEQYTGGRVKGRKNLKKLEDGSLLNQHGVTFTQHEKKALESVVNRANRKRMKMLEDEGSLPRFMGGKDTGDTVASLQRMGKESDFILSRKHKSLQKFKSKEEFERYLSNVERTLDPNYITDRIRLYKRNHMQALENVFGDDAKDVMMKIRMMKPEQYMEMIQKDEMLEVGYVYDPSARAGKLNQIRASLGMKLKEEEYDDVE